MGNFYFYEAEPDVKRVALDVAAKQLSTSVTNAHWQWQAEGRPQIIMMIHYDVDGSEKGRRAIRMNSQGRPAFEQTSEGCGKLWQKVLNLPLSIEGFKVVPEYYQAQHNPELNESFCRYRLSTGPYFDYMVLSSRITELKG